MSTPNKFSTAQVFSGLLFFAVFVLVCQHAWVTDDAFISFRTAKNFVAGNGLRYNVDERVQSFTHPLWLLLLIAGQVLGVNLYFWAIALGLLFSAELLTLLWKQTVLSQDWLLAALIVCPVLASSDIFLSFQTSGLENALTNVLTIVFFLSVAKTQSLSSLLVSTLLGSLVLLNRMDVLWLIFPAAMFSYLTNAAPVLKKLAIVSLGLIPIVVWEAFSVVYYGFLFPNTRYAKIGGRTLFESTGYGWCYLFDYAQFEPLQFGLIIFVFAAFVITRFRRRDLLFCVALGILCHLVYVIALGGDFMRGRFLVCDLVAAVFALLYHMRASEYRFPLTFVERALILFLVASGSVYALLVVEIPVPLEAVAHNERNYFGPYLWLSITNPERYKEHPWAVEAQALNQSLVGTNTTVVGVNGQRSFYVGSNVDLIDPAGLSDAFIARTPVTDATRAGHFQRAIPEEYITERTTGVRVQHWKNSKLEQLWRDLQVITQSDDLWSQKRFDAMWRVWNVYGF